MRLPVRTGDLFCDGIDVSDFRASCFVAILPNLWNTWAVLVARTVPPDDVRDAVTAFVSDAIEEAGGQVHDVEVSTAPLTAAGRPAKRPDTFGPRTRTQHWQSVCPAWAGRMSLASGPYRLVSVRFVVRELAVPVIPWPAMRLLPGGITKDCPSDATLLLEAAYGPLAGERVPDPPSLFPDWKWPELPKLELPSAGDVAKGAAAVLLPVLLVGGLAVGLMVAVARHQSRKAQEAGVMLLRMRSRGEL